MRKLNILKYAILWLFLVLICMNSIPSTLAMYRETKNKTLTISIKHPTYTISFDANGGTGSMDDQEFTYGVSQTLTSNTFTNSGYTFTGWNTEIDGTGTPYINEQSITNLSSVDGDTITLYAQWINDTYVAKIGTNQYFTSLQSAVTSVDNDGVEVTITLLKNTTENITVNAGQNIRFNFQNFKLDNTNANSLIKNYGTIKISNGTLTNTSSATSALIDNYSTGNIEITGGTITALGSKQAVYNEGGTVRISGNPRISSKASGTYDKVERATVQNRLNGTTYITGGTIINSNASAVSINTGTVNIGTKDDDPNPNSLLIQGKTYGVYNYTAFNFYDGTIQAQKGNNNNSVFSLANISAFEEGLTINTEIKTISNVQYYVSTLLSGSSVSFNANGGTVDETMRSVDVGEEIGTLPIPTRYTYLFDGWFTSASGGTKIESDYIITENDYALELFAHWHQEAVASVNGIDYLTLQAAIDVVSANNQETEITVLRSFSENVTVAANKNILLNIGNYTITGFKDAPIITNKGVVKITNGNLVQNKVYAAINNEGSGKLYMSGGNITSTGERACVYNRDSGKAYISGSSYLTSNATGQLIFNNMTINRATVMNVSSYSLAEVTGGTIIGTDGDGISGYGTITIGIKDDGIIDSTTPTIIGKVYGINNSNILNFYDGTIKGVSNAVSGSITEQQTQNIVNGTEQIGDSTYITIHLE